MYPTHYANDIIGFLWLNLHLQFIYYFHFLPFESKTHFVRSFVRTMPMRMVHQVYVATQGEWDKRYIYALDKGKGTEKWKFEAEKSSKCCK